MVESWLENDRDDRSPRRDDQEDSTPPANSHGITQVVEPIHGIESSAVEISSAEGLVHLASDSPDYDEDSSNEVSGIPTFTPPPNRLSSPSRPGHVAILPGQGTVDDFGQHDANLQLSPVSLQSRSAPNGSAPDPLLAPPPLVVVGNRAQVASPKTPDVPPRPASDFPEGRIPATPTLSSPREHSASAPLSHSPLPSSSPGSSRSPPPPPTSTPPARSTPVSSSDDRTPQPSPRSTGESNPVSAESWSESDHPAVASGRTDVVEQEIQRTIRYRKRQREAAQPCGAAGSNSRKKKTRAKALSIANVLDYFADTDEYYVELVGGKRTRLDSDQVHYLLGGDNAFSANSARAWSADGRRVPLKMFRKSYTNHGGRAGTAGNDNQCGFVAVRMAMDKLGLGECVSDLAVRSYIQSGKSDRWKNDYANGMHVRWLFGFIRQLQTDEWYVDPKTLRKNLRRNGESSYEEVKTLACDPGGVYLMLIIERSRQVGHFVAMHNNGSSVHVGDEAGWRSLYSFRGVLANSNISHIGQLKIILKN